MASKPKRPGVLTQPSAFPVRANEGVLIDAKIQHAVHTDGVTHASVGVELHSAPVPARRYVGEVCSVARIDGWNRIVFGQPKIMGDSLRSALIILMSDSAVGNFLNSLISVKELHDDERIPLYELKSEPDHTVTAVANFVVAGMGESEACIDFYHASPFSMAAIGNTQKLAVEPVVRVDLRSGLFWTVVEALTQLVPPVSTVKESS